MAVPSIFLALSCLILFPSQLVFAGDGNVEVAGFVLCKDCGPLTTFPLRGATVDVICSDANGTFFSNTATTDAVGHFEDNIPGIAGHIGLIQDCLVTLGSSSVAQCNVKTNVGNGISGVHLGTGGTKDLYIVGPFAFTTQKCLSPPSPPPSSSSPPPPPPSPPAPPPASHPPPPPPFLASPPPPHSPPPPA